LASRDKYGSTVKFYKEPRAKLISQTPIHERVCVQLNCRSTILEYSLAENNESISKKRGLECLWNSVLPCMCGEGWSNGDHDFQLYNKSPWSKEAQHVHRLIILGQHDEGQTWQLDLQKLKTNVTFASELERIISAVGVGIWLIMNIFSLMSGVVEKIIIRKITN
jgi:hypothetical protein